MDLSHPDLHVAMRYCQATTIWEQCDCRALDEGPGVSRSMNLQLIIVHAVATTMFTHDALPKVGQIAMVRLHLRHSLRAIGKIPRALLYI